MHVGLKLAYNQNPISIQHSDTTLQCVGQHWCRISIGTLED